jgi:hypothetical protein
MTLRAQLLAAIDHERDRIVDLQITVREAKDQVDRDVIVLRDRVFELNRATQHLDDLVSWLDAPEFSC